MPVLNFSHLSREERLQLIDELWESLETEDVPLTPAQQAELERRLALDEAGAMETFSWEEIDADRRARHG